LPIQGIHRVEITMSKKTPMTKQAASRIQSAVDRKGGDSGFKSRAASAAVRNNGSGKSAGGHKGGKR
jgi:hypothetical protein